MLPVGPSRSKRRRNKSSPGHEKVYEHRRGLKLNKGLNEAGFQETSDSEYFSDVSDTSSVTPVPTLLPITPSTTTMVKLSQADIDDIVAKLGPSLVKEIKAQLMSEVKKLVKKETTKILGDMETLRSDNKTLTDELAQTKRDLDALEQYGRRMCLDVSGIPGDTGSFTENVEAKVLEHAKKCKITLHSSDIDRCHRKGKPKNNTNRKVIIKFTNSKARQHLYQARKDLGIGVYVQENLSPLREKLSYEARQLKRTGTLDNTWVAGCSIRAKLPGINGKVITIRDEIDIQCIKDGKPLPVYNLHDAKM